jgi:exonuclease III
MPRRKTIAEIIQRTRPDVLLINEFDFVEGGLAAELFQENYLSVSRTGQNRSNMTTILSRHPTPASPPASI